MGSNQVSDYFPEKKEKEDVSYGELISRVCPDYLAMGMTLDEYWNGDPSNLEYVRKAHLLRRKQANFDAWLNGHYVYIALQCVSPMFRDWLRDHHPEKYPNEPIDIYPKQVEKTDEEKLADKKELANQATIRAWVDRVNRLQANKQKEESAHG